MNTFVWNAHRLGSLRAFNALRSFKQEVNLDLMFLVETKCDHVKLEILRTKLGFSGKLVVNSTGKSGGLCLFWTNCVVVDLLSYSQGHIDSIISGLGGKRWRFTGFYGHPEQSQRKNSWSLLQRLAGMSSLPWVCIGDFNEILYDKEKMGDVKKNWKDMLDFREALEVCNLEDMGYAGPNFTWSNKRDGGSLILERLDRDFCNKEWRRLFPHYVIRHLEFWSSGHRPLVLAVTDGQRKKTKAKRFFFEECWIEDKDCKSIVDAAWKEPGYRSSSESVLSKIDRCGKMLNSWNIRKRREHCEDLHNKKEALRKASSYNVPVSWKLNC